MSDLHRKADALWRQGATEAEQQEVDEIDRQLDELQTERKRLAAERHRLVTRFRMRTVARRPNV